MTFLTRDTPIVVIHAPGDPRGGAAWREALASVWDGPVLAPDLPGHGSTPAPVGGSYELGDALLSIVPQLNDRGWSEPPIVVGAGVNGWPAQVLALAGRASAVVIVDGLNGPWRAPHEAIAAGRAWLRAIADDPAAVGPAPASGLDPRLRYGIGRHGSKRLALRAAAAMPVPALIVESGGSGVGDNDLDELVAAYAAGAAVVRVADADPRRVVDAITTWSVTKADTFAAVTTST